MAFGLALKSLSLVLRLIQFGACAVVLGIFSYFLWELHHHNLYINHYDRAIEGIAGAGVVYTVLALIFVCFLGGISFFSFLGVLLDLAFTGAFIFVAYETRAGAHSCHGYVNTPLGDGFTRNDGQTLTGIRLTNACRLNTAVFAVSIIALVLFFITIFVGFGLARVHKKDKAYGPSPNNGYTAGPPQRKFWQRKQSPRDAEFAAAEKPDALPVHATPADYRTSYATDATAVGNEPGFNKYGNNATMTGAAGNLPPQVNGTTDAAYTPYRTDGTM